MSWQKLKISDILHRIKDAVSIQDDVEYRRVTIRINHKGLTQRDKVFGREIGTKTMFKVKEGQFAISGIDARHAAFGIIPAELEGAIVTNDFWIFDVDTKIIETEYFYWLTTSPIFLDICRKASIGMTNRVRLQGHLFQNFEIKIPKLNEQKATLDKIRVFDSKILELKTELAHQLDLVKQLRQQFLQEAVQGVLIKNEENTEGVAETGQQLLQRIKAEKAKSSPRGGNRKGGKEKPLPPISKEEIPFDIPDDWVWCRLGKLEN